jgi:hypothetical protein
MIVKRINIMADNNKKNGLKGKVSLNETKIKDITFFEEDISEMSNQLESGEKLYKNLYDVYYSLTGGKYSNIKSPRDIAEIAKALVQIRNLCSDAAFRRHQIRKNLSDIVYRNTGGETSDEEILKEAARTIINEVRSYEKNNGLGKDKAQNYLLTDEVRRQLDSKVQGYIEKGDISLSTNDKLIGIASHVEFKFDKENDKFIALDGRNGKVIPDFPKERLPEKQISRFTKNRVVTKTGDSYEILGDD